MKKFLKLTSQEAIRHFLLRDKTLVPESSSELRQKYQELEKLKSELSVSIVIPTHRTRPDSDIDVILLKNKIQEVEEKLFNMLEKREAQTIVDNIKEAQEMIDYTLGLDSLVLYANEHFSSVVRLPVELESEVLIGKEFDLRPLYKARQQNSRYYILTVSKNVIRLIEAFNDKITGELKNEDFPLSSAAYYADEPKELGQESFLENQEKEFYNDADKLFQKYYNENPLPVILAGDVKSVSHYEEQMDSDCMIIARVHGSFDHMPYHEMTKIICSEIVKYKEEQQTEYLSKIENAISANLETRGLNEIYKAAAEGRADTLYIGESYSLDKIAISQITLLDETNRLIEPHEFLPQLIKHLRDNGSNVIFMEDSLVDQYQGIILVRRY